MITLYGFGAGFGLLDASPFVVKIDFFLKLSGLEYQFKGDVKYLKQSPKGKLPFIDDDGEKVADSDFIIKYLTEKYNVTLDDHLCDEQKAQASLYTKALDESLYWCLVHSRWICDETWPKVEQRLFGKLPRPLKWFVPKMLRNNIRKTLHSQGYGRHTREEIIAIADQHFSALSTLLGEKRYFFGEQPSSFDAVAYSMLCEFISVDILNDFNIQAGQYKNLVSYCRNIEREFYS